MDLYLKPRHWRQYSSENAKRKNSESIPFSVIHDLLTQNIKHLIEKHKI